MVYLPNEIVNIIISYVERPSHSKWIHYLIEDCYKKDYNPYTAENWSDYYCFEYTFYEWYFLYRLQCKLGGMQFNSPYNKSKCITVWDKKYKHTPSLLKVGIDKHYYYHFYHLV